MSTSYNNWSFSALTAAIRRGIERNVVSRQAEVPSAAHQTDRYSEHRGIKLKAFLPMPGSDTWIPYLEPDFLRGDYGAQLLFNYSDAYKEITRRNDGREYGDGTETSIRQALSEGTYQEGDLVIPPEELIWGYSSRGEHVRINVLALLEIQSKAFATIERTIQSAPIDPSNLVSARSVVCSTECSNDPSLVRYVNLWERKAGWGAKDRELSGVIPVRFYRSTAQEQPAV